MKVPIEIDQIEPMLARLWDERPGRAMVRARTVTLVVVCTGSNEVARACDAAARLLPVHPGRAVIVCLQGEGTAAITAKEIGLVQSPDRAAEPSGERIVLEVWGAARAWVPAAIEHFLLPGAQVYLWWLGDIPDHDTLYDKLAEIADVIALNSAEVDVGGLVKLDRLVRAAAGRYVLADLAWVHLRWWQELLARFFDDPAVRPCLQRVQKLVLSCAFQRGGGAAVPTSTAAGLYAGWFATRIGVDVSQASWTRISNNVWQAVMSSPCGPFTVHFENLHRASVDPGALLRVELYTHDGSRFEVARDGDDPRVFGWLGECKGATIPHAVLKVGVPDEVELLVRHIASPVRDPLFETSLYAAARILTLGPAAK